MGANACYCWSYVDSFTSFRPLHPSYTRYNPNKWATRRYRTGREHGDRTLGGVTMSANHPTAPTESVKSAKPSKHHPDFPLSPHAAGVWAKKIRGKPHYFGPWDDLDAALEKYLAEKDDLHAGRKPRTDPEALTVKDACNAFLNAKQAQVDEGLLSPLTWGDYETA